MMTLTVCPNCNENMSIEEVNACECFNCGTSLISDKGTKVKYPIGGYAPGYYMCKCVDCGNGFMGDKRAVQCEPCAINAINESNIQSLIKLNKLVKSLKSIKLGNDDINDILNKYNL